MPKSKEEVEMHIKIPRDLMKELSQRAEQKRISRTELIEDSLREHLRRIRMLQNAIAVKEQEIEEQKQKNQPSRDMNTSSILDILEQPTTIISGWEYERIANLFLRALDRFEHIFCPIEAWRKIKETLPPSRRAIFSQFTDYELLCRILYPQDPYYFERCLQTNKDIYLVADKHT